MERMRERDHAALRSKSARHLGTSLLVYLCRQSVTEYWKQAYIKQERLFVPREGTEM